MTFDNLLRLAEIETLIIGAFIILGICAVFILHLLPGKLKPCLLRDILCDIIYKLDETAHNLTNAEKKEQAIEQLKNKLGWKSIIVPDKYLGWLIDLCVAFIRYSQQKGKLNLKPRETKESETNETSNPN